jgi:hypothetical protein
MSIIQNFYKAKLTRNWSATTGDFNVSVKPTSPNGWLVLSPNNPTLREIVRFTATGTNIYGDFVTIANLADRGVGGTVAQTHTIGEDIRMNLNAEYWAEMQGSVDAIIAGDFIAPGPAGEVPISDGSSWISGEVGTKFSNTEVFNGTSPSTWTDLDLSSVVGAKQRVVLLRFSTTGTSIALAIKTKGDTKTYTTNSSYSSNSAMYIPNNTYSGTLIVKTDTSGVIQWYTSGSVAGVMIDVLAYW